MPPQEKNLVLHRRASFEYELLDRFEAGLQLLGSEVKSMRAGKANLAEAFVRVDRNEAWLMRCHVAPYLEANRFNHEAMRPKKLLLHRHQISKLRKASSEKGMTVVPLRLYLAGHLVKLEIAVGRGKKLHDKRHAIKEREAKRQLRQR